PDGAFRQPQLGGDIGDRRAIDGSRQYVPLARREGIVPLAERGQGQPWIQHSLARSDPAYGTRQLRSGGILHEKADGTALHRAPQVADPAERGQDDHPARGKHLAQCRGSGEPVFGGEIDIEQRDIGPRLERRGYDPVAALYLGHDSDVLLQPEQRRQGAAHHRLVFREQHADHPLTSLTTGTLIASSNLPSDPAPASTLPP